MSSIEQFLKDSEEIYEELANVLGSKQLDYGPGNINNAPGGATDRSRGAGPEQSRRRERFQERI